MADKEKKAGKEEMKKIWISRERKELFRWYKKHLIFFEGLSFGENQKFLKKIVDTALTKTAVQMTWLQCFMVAE